MKTVIKFLLIIALFIFTIFSIVNISNATVSPITDSDLLDLNAQIDLQANWNNNVTNSNLIDNSSNNSLNISNNNTNSQNTVNNTNSPIVASSNDISNIPTNFEDHTLSNNIIPSVGTEPEVILSIITVTILISLIIYFRFRKIEKDETDK